MPMEFYINGDIWEIIFVRPDSVELWNDNRFTVGVTDRSTHTIYLSDEISGQFLEDVLRHELCHASMMSYGYDMSIPEEECFCQIIEKRGEEIDDLTDLLLQNME